MAEKEKETAAKEAAAKRKSDAEAKAAAEAAAAEAAKADDEGEETVETAPKKRTEKTFTKAEMDAAIKKQLDDAQKKWEAEKDLSELERLKKQNAELQESMRMRDAKEEVVAALTASGANSPALAFEAIKQALKFDDGGKLVNSKDLIEQLKTSYPEQFGTPKPTDGIDAGKGKTADGAKFTAEQLAKMTPAEINKLDWTEVSTVLAAAK